MVVPSKLGRLRQEEHRFEASKTTSKEEQKFLKSFAHCVSRTTLAIEVITQLLCLVAIVTVLWRSNLFSWAFILSLLLRIALSSNCGALATLQPLLSLLTGISFYPLSVFIGNWQIVITPWTGLAPEAAASLCPVTVGKEELLSVKPQP